MSVLSRLLSADRPALLLLCDQGPAYSTNLVPSGQEGPPPVLAGALDIAVRLCYTGYISTREAEMFTAVTDGPTYTEFTDKDEAIAFVEQHESGEVLKDYDTQVWLKFPAARFI